MGSAVNPFVVVHPNGPYPGPTLFQPFWATADQYVLKTAILDQKLPFGPKIYIKMKSEEWPFWNLAVSNHFGARKNLKTEEKKSLGPPLLTHCVAGQREIIENSQQSVGDRREGPAAPSSIS